MQKPSFIQVFWGGIVLLVISILIAFVATALSKGDPSFDQLAAIGDHGIETTFGALIGLIVGKATT